MIPQLILGSSSPRRRELLTAAGYEFDVVPPDDQVECGICSNQGPAELVMDLATHKAVDVQRRLASRWPTEPLVLLTADTVAECDGMILGKPDDLDHARDILRRLSGREHRVYTGVAVWKAPSVDAVRSAAPLAKVAVTTLVMDPLSDAQLDYYLETGSWQGKAGAFGYQDGLDWVHITEGSASNVVGLPMELVAEMLGEIGYPVPNGP